MLRFLADENLKGDIVRGVPSQLSVRQAIDEIVWIATCSEEHEWTGRVLYLPL